MKKISFTLLLILSVWGVLGQNLDSLATPYEQNRFELAKSTVEKMIQYISYDEAIVWTEKFSYANGSKWRFIATCEEFVEYVYSTKGYYAPVGNCYQAYLRQKKALEQTKTAMDIQREKQRAVRNE